MEALYHLLYLVPKNHISRLSGWVVNALWPFSLHRVLRDWFIKQYRIDVSEAELPLDEYPTLGQFFARKLKDGARPIASARMVCPVDAALTETGLFDPIHAELRQIKAKKYSLIDLIGPGWDMETYRRGGYATLYLAPHNYHRIHAPMRGRVTRVLHIPGKLWPVNDWSVRSIDNLFPRNERLVLELEGEESKCLVVLVGATNVGRITLDFQPLFATNEPGRIRPRQWFPRDLVLEKGAPLGCFHLGSTVVMLMPRQEYLLCEPVLRKALGGVTRMGQGLLP